MVSRLSFPFARNSAGEVLIRLKHVLKTPPGRGLGNVLKKACRDFNLRPIVDIFETKIRTSLLVTSLCWLGTLR